MASIQDSVAGETQSGDSTVVRAQLAIEPHPDSHCGVVKAGDADLTHHLKRENPSTEGEQSCTECHTEIQPAAGGDAAEYHTSDVRSKCICPVFESHDCIPEIRAVRSRTIIVGLTVPEQEVLREILTDLKRIDATVSVDWIIHGSTGDSLTEIDATTITAKQREAMQTARERGYYETPRTATLSDLASELGISKSAVSQRLNTAETKLVKSFLKADNGQ